jgi:poly(3-hydroxybutyrate) depolymerase
VLDMPAEYYMDTIQVVFQDFALCNGTWQVRGELVRPQDITKTALLTVEGELDDISGAGQTHAAHELCTGIPKNAQFKYDAKGAGHYGIFSGRRWREMIYPAIRDFIAQHQVVRNAPAHAPIVALTDDAVTEKAAPQTPPEAAKAVPVAQVAKAAAPLKRAAAVKSAAATSSTKAAPKPVAKSASAKTARKPAAKSVKS